MDFKRAPEKMIKEYNDRRALGNTKLKLTKNRDVVEFSADIFNTRTGRKKSTREINLMSISSLEAIKSKLENDTILIGAFLLECSRLT